MEGIKYQFNGGTFNNATFASRKEEIPRLLTTPGATVPTGFIGREQELEEIHERLNAGGNALVLVNTEGGMGKTTLAAAYWKRFNNQYQHLAWLFCENGILNAMRNNLIESLGLREQINAVADDADKQVRLIINAMANLPKNGLLVLDNANEPAHIQGFEQYAAGLGWQILITSRCAGVLTDTGAEYSIQSLPPEDAKRLFRSQYDEKTPEFEALLDQFLHAVGYNTLCIEVFSKNLHAGSGGWSDLTFEKLLQKLEANGLKLEEDSFEIKTQWAQNLRSDATNSDQIIEALYKVSSLPSEAGELLARFCLLPSANHEASVLIALLAPNDRQGLKRGLDQLAQKGWLNTEDQKYRVSPVVQKIVLRQYADSRWSLGKDMVAQLNVIFENEGQHSINIKTAQPFAELIPDLVDNLATANEDLVMLLNRLWVNHVSTGNLLQAMQTAEKMKGLCEKFEYKSGLALSYEKLGNTYKSLGNLEKALFLFQEMKKLFEELLAADPKNDEFQNGLAISYSKLGLTHNALGNLPSALTFLEESIRLAKALHESRPNNIQFKKGLAISYQCIGLIYHDLGKLTEALTFFEEYTRLAKELHESRPDNREFKKGLAISYQCLGDAYRALGKPSEAIIYFDSYNQIMTKLYEDYPQDVSFKIGLAISYQFLGNAHADLGNWPTALTCYEEYNLIERELYKDYPQDVFIKNSLAISYSKLRATHSSLGNLDKALGFLEDETKLFEELYAAYPQNVDFKNNLAISYYKLGEISKAQNDNNKAKAHFQSAETLWLELVRDAPQYVQFQEFLGFVQADIKALD